MCEAVRELVFKDCWGLDNNSFMATRICRYDDDPYCYRLLHIVFSIRLLVLVYKCVINLSMVKSQRSTFIVTTDKTVYLVVSSVSM